MKPGHAYVAQHYKWTLDRIFLERGHSHAIVLEDGASLCHGWGYGLSTSTYYLLEDNVSIFQWLVPMVL